MRFHSRLGLGLWLLAIAGAPTLLRGESPAPPSLGTAESFAVLGGTSVNSTGSTVVTGNLGVSPGNTISGSITVKVGATYRNDAIARQAQKDATSAYNNLAIGTCPGGFTDPELGGKTLDPGMYCFSTAHLTGTLVLRATSTDPNAPWIFKIKNSLTTDPNASVVVVNGGHENNIFWQVGDSVTLGAGTAFLGNVLALKDIALGNGASVSGRLLAQGAVTLNGNNVSLCCGLITLSAATFPNATVGTAYGPITITASGGLEPYSFAALQGSLPPGVTISIKGVVSGTPTAAGSYSPTIIATDSTKVCSGSRTYNKINSSCPVITVLPSAMPPSPDVPYLLSPATACIPYVQTFSAVGGTIPYTFNLTPGSLGGPGPSDITLLDPLHAELTWTPKKSGKYTFTVAATDTFGCSGSQIYEVLVACEAISISPPTIPPGQVCARYNQPIKAIGCDPSYVLSLESGELPPGLTLAPPGNGNAIVGIPTKTGPYRFTIKATDADDAACFVTRDYTIVITCPAITISPSVLPPATTCQRYCVKLTPSCAIGSTRFDVTGGTLPPGLSLSLDGLLCGKPSVAGTYSWTVTFTDSDSGCTGSVIYTLTVTGLTITPACPPEGTPSVPYSELFTASGGTAPYTFIFNGALPPGLIFMQTTPTTATISGTPTAPGCFPITITVTDANGCTTSTTCTMCVAAGGPALSGWGMVVLSILLVGVGFVAIRRGG